MTEYHKIQTVFKRDPANRNKTLLEGEFSIPEFEYLKDNLWIWTEKVDGANIRVCKTMDDSDQWVTYKGRTADSEIPKPLLQYLREKFDPQGADIPGTLYGEGYGPKIQRGGGNYREDPAFVLFDVKIDDWWLKREDVDDIAETLGIESVPIIGEGTLAEMVEFCRAGFKSQWGDFRAEGIVARPKTELFDRGSRRIITKLKCRDFR